MPNTNFQTIFQMGQAINDMVKQATGRDVVQTIEMGQVTVAQNHIAVDGTASGAVAEFITHAEVPLQIIADVNPVQNLNGYDYPWPGGAGKNMLDPSWCPQYENGTYTSNGVTFTINRDGTIIANGTAAGGDSQISFFLTNKFSGDYYYCSNITEGTISDIDVYVWNVTQGARAKKWDGTTNSASSGNERNLQQVKLNDTDTIQLSLRVHEGYIANNVAIQPMIMNSTETDTTFEPYSNICPITGWTGAEITVSPSDDPAEGTVYTVTFPESAGTVYGGTLTINKDGTGELVVDTKQIVYDGSDDETWSYSNGRCYIGGTFSSEVDQTVKGISNMFKWNNNVKSPIGNISLGEISYGNTEQNYQINVYPAGMSSASDFTTYLASNNLQVIYKLSTTISILLTVPQIQSLIGSNYVSANTGNVTVNYTDIVEGGGN